MLTSCVKLSWILRFCSLFRHLVVLFLLHHLITNERTTNQAFVLRSPAFAGTQNPSCVYFYFFCPTDRPTFERGRAMGKETFYWDGLINREWGHYREISYWGLDCANNFFKTKGNKKILIHKEKSCFPFSATSHREIFDIFKKAVLDFCGVQSFAEANGLERAWTARL